VLNRQTEEVQRTLLQTAVLEQFNSSLVETMTGQVDGQSILHRLEQANLFIFPLDHDRRWYRYHPLFRDLLLKQLQRRWTPEAIKKLHELAEDWYERNGLVEDAIQHAVSGSNFERAADLIESAFEVAPWKRADIERLRNQPATAILMKRRSAALRTLTERENQVLVLIAAGLSNEEIAAELVVTINTVRTHIKSINRKFGVRSRTQAVYQAQRLGLLSSG
jgi:ATP/maltotriose-dependent transcriptional regulator MalT